MKRNRRPNDRNDRIKIEKSNEKSNEKTKKKRKEILKLKDEIRREERPMKTGQLVNAFMKVRHNIPFRLFALLFPLNETGRQIDYR